LPVNVHIKHWVCIYVAGNSVTPCKNDEGDHGRCSARISLKYKRHWRAVSFPRTFVVPLGVDHNLKIRISKRS
jgi:hypothetical protein